jgi:hypothetical protein
MWKEMVGLLWQSDAMYEVLEARVCAEVIMSLFDFEEGHPHYPLLVTLLRPHHALILLAQAHVKFRRFEACWLDCG